MGSGWISIIRGYGHDGSIIRDRNQQQQQQQQQFHVHLVLDELGDEELTVSVGQDLRLRVEDRLEVVVVLDARGAHVEQRHVQPARARVHTRARLVGLERGKRGEGVDKRREGAHLRARRAKLGRSGARGVQGGETGRAFARASRGAQGPCGRAVGTSAGRASSRWSMSGSVVNAVRRIDSMTSVCWSGSATKKESHAAFAGPNEALWPKCLCSHDGHVT